MFLPSKSTKVLTLTYCIRKVPISNFRRDTDCLETLVVFVNLICHVEIFPTIINNIDNQLDATITVY